jgi:hypothetical protein
MSRVIKSTAEIRRSKRLRQKARRYHVKYLDYLYGTTNSLAVAHLMYAAIRLYTFFEEDLSIVDTKAEE